MGLFIVFLIFSYGSLAGYLVHLLLHNKIVGRFAKDHTAHHNLYTVDDFVSNKYRSAGGKASTFVFVPIITCAMALLCIPLWFLTHVWWIFAIVIIEGIFVGWLNDYIHEVIHLKKHWLHKYKWFQKLKYLHRLHHKYPHKNHGIIWFIPDKLFGTFNYDNHNHPV